MRYQRTSERRAVILMVVLSLLTLFAIVGVTFVLYADAEAAAARVAREAQTVQTSEVNPEVALSFFLNQLIYDVPDTLSGVGSSLRGHSLARTMYGLNYLVPPGSSMNLIPFNGVGRLHYASASALPYPGGLTNVPNNFAGVMDDYALVNYSWFSANPLNANDPLVRDPERFGARTFSQVTSNVQVNAYVGGNAPYTYPDLNSFFLAAVRADGTVLTPSYHRPWLFQVTGGKPYAFNDMTNPNWYNLVGKYLTLRPRPAEHPAFPLPGDATGDVKNLPWAPGGNDSIWIDLGAPVMTAPDGTKYKMMFAPLILDLDGRVNLNTAGNMQAYVAAMAASAAAGTTSNTLAWQFASTAHVSNQGWGPWEVNLSKALWGDQAVYPYPQTTPPTPPEWMRLFTGMTYATTTAPNALPFIAQPGVAPPWPMPGGGLSAWLLPGVRGRYLETVVTAPPYPPGIPPGGIPLYPPGGTPGSLQLTPNAAGLIYLNGNPGVGGTYAHAYSQVDFNGLNDFANGVPSSRPLLPGAPATPAWSDPAANPATNLFAMFQQGFINGTAVEGMNHPLLYNAFQSALTSALGTRAFRASDMEALLRPSVSVNGPVNANSSAENSDLMRMCPANFPGGSILSSLPNSLKSLALRYRNLVTTQSWDIGSPGVTPYWWNGMAPTSYLAANGTYYLLAPSAQTPGPLGFPPLPPTFLSGNVPGTNPMFSEFGNNPPVGLLLQPDWRALSANSFTYFPTTNPAGYVTPGARIRLNRPLPPYPHMGALVTPPYNSQPPGATASPYGAAYNLGTPGIANQFTAAQNARQAMANDIYRRLVAVAGLHQTINKAAPTPQELAPRRWLAQLAVNIVDYIDEDDIMTPFNFYSAADINPANPAAVTPAQLGVTQGGDDNIANNNANTYATGENPLYWVFGTELPKVVLNEAVAEAQNPDATKSVSNDQVQIWVELFNTMTAGAGAGANTQPQDGYRVPLYIAAGANNGWSPYIITIAQSTGVPDQNLMPNRVSYGPNSGALLPDQSCNVLGKVNNLGYGPNWSTPPTTYKLPWSTTAVDFSAANVQQMGGGAQPANPNSPGVSVGIDPTGVAGLSPYFLMGPKPAATNPYLEAFAAQNGPSGVPNNTPVLRTQSLIYNPTWWNTARPTAPYDERTTGLSLVLRRLANPYLPPQTDPKLPNYNPYVTVDYMANVPIQSQQALKNGNTENYCSRGKNQPFSGLTLLKANSTSAGDGNLWLSNPAYPANMQTAGGSSPVALQYGPNAYQASNGNGSYVLNTFGKQNYPMPDSGHYDWLVHLDRSPISPMELLHVSAWPPYMLTQRFVTNNPLAAIPAAQGSDNVSTPASPTTTTPNLNNALNLFGHYAPWFDTLPAGTTASTMACPWWFDPNLPAGSSHRLYRLFEFLESGDRALGVNGLGRIPGKVNLNTVWDPEVLHALIDANMSMGTTTNLPFATPPLTYCPINPTNGLPWNAGNPAIAGDAVSQIFNNMLLSRSPAYSTLGTYANPVPWLNIGPVNMGTGVDDRPFMPLSTGQYLAFGTPAGGPQFPNGLSVTTDTILRTNNPFGKPGSYPIPTPAGPAANTWLQFQNYYDPPPGSPPGLTTAATHPYYQTQLLTKLYNNITTRSNTFAVFLMVGFFQVMTDTAGNVLPALGTPGQVNIPQLGPEIGRSEGKQVRHRMFAIIDRTNLATFMTTGQAVLPATMVTGPTPSVVTPIPVFNPTGLQTIQIPAPVTPATPNTTVTGTATQLFVANPLTGFPGVITAGTQLVIDPGQINEETVTVISVTPPASPGLAAFFTANFTLPHGVGNTPFAIIQRGNPGPWVLTPYDPRLDSSVVQYFSIID